VFEQLTPEEPQQLELREVAAAGWTPLESVVSNTHVSLLDWRDEAGKRTPWSGFPAVQLPMGDQELWLAEGGNKAEARSRFQLWGLTLSLVNDLLVESGLREDKIDHDLLQKLSIEEDEPKSRL